MDADDFDPFGPHYEAYCEWLMANEPICNGDQLTEYMERGHRAQEFIETLPEA